MSTSKTADEKIKLGTRVRHCRTGDLYFFKMHEGRPCFVRDVPNNPKVYSITQSSQFVVETTPDKLPPGSLANIAYEADTAVCKNLPGSEKKKPWLSLHPQEKADWIRGQMTLKSNKIIRRQVYNAIMKVLQEYTL